MHNFFDWLKYQIIIKQTKKAISKYGSHIQAPSTRRLYMAAIFWRHYQKEGVNLINTPISTRVLYIKHKVYIHKMFYT